MTFIKTNWQDRIIERPNTYNIEDNIDGSITLTPVTGIVTQEGTPLNANNLNTMEDRIASSLEENKNNLQQQINNLVLEAGDSSTEVLQARSSYSVLNDRLDLNFNNVFAEGFDIVNQKLNDVNWTFAFVGSAGELTTTTNTITSDKIKTAKDTTIKLVDAGVGYNKYRVSTYNPNGTVSRSDYITANTNIPAGTEFRVSLQTVGGGSPVMIETNNIARTIYKNKTKIALDNFLGLNKLNFRYQGGTILNRLQALNVSFKAGDIVECTDPDMLIAAWIGTSVYMGWVSSYTFTEDVTVTEIRFRYADDRSFTSLENGSKLFKWYSNDTLISKKDYYRFNNSSGNSSGDVVMYVSTSGSDANDGSSSLPLATVQKALEKGATTIILKSGTYNEVVSVSDKNTLALKSETSGGNVIFSNAVSLTGITLDGATGLLKTTKTFANTTNWYKYFIGQTIPLEHDVTGGTTISKKAYNAILFEMTGEMGQDYCLKPVLSLSECQSTVGSFFYDGANIYINKRYSGSTTYKYQIKETIDENTNHQLSFNNIKNLKIEGIKTEFSANNGFNIISCLDTEIKNCRADYSCGNEGFTVQDSFAEFIRCTANRNHVDGFGLRGTGIGNFHDCSGSYNLDDGISHHDNMGGAIYGGEWHHNGKGGLSPSHGAEVHLYNCFSHDNPYGIYSGADRYLGRKQFYNNCVCYNNTTDIKVLGFNVVSYNSKYTTLSVASDENTSFTQI